MFLFDHVSFDFDFMVYVSAFLFLLVLFLVFCCFVFVLLVFVLLVLLLVYDKSTVVPAILVFFELCWLKGSFFCFMFLFLFFSFVFLCCLLAVQNNEVAIVLCLCCLPFFGNKTMWFSSCSCVHKPCS